MNQIPKLVPATLLLAAACLPTVALPYAIVDTGQDACFNATVDISPPAQGAAFYGQDAQYEGHAPSYALSGDGLTVYDNVTGLTWVALPDTDGNGVLESVEDKLSWDEAQAWPATLNASGFGGYSDWRLPTIKELYSLILFTGIDPSGYQGDVSGLVPFIDTDYFSFVYGDESQGERIIDSQYASSNLYVDSSGEELLFGVNFADGRIKGYGLTMPFGGGDKTFFVQCCRGNESYGDNDFVDNGDGTVTDLATGLMWQQDDSGEGLIWEDALAYAEGLVLAGADDWRLPNVKELQSILDYTRSPGTTGSAAIDPVFDCTGVINEGGQADFPYYWSSTTHENWTDTNGGFASYAAFGRGLGYMMGSWQDVHGAGCQRSDPKDGDPDDYPYGHGPQGDAIRIYNFVRCVRDADSGSEVGETPSAPAELQLDGMPNPFNPGTTLRFSLPESDWIKLAIFDIQGRFVRELVNEPLAAGEHAVSWDGLDDYGRPLPSGVYFARISNSTERSVEKLVMVK